ncbi:hypothetical protein [Brucella pituitosa]|uniref:hypothetical protein n=1 Tax=Brucella pituitosa TaxID=571256 RepID=UPI000C27D443|nr:hypothetical protein [Brucella pituitosa]PJO47191.1 hypothetical protein CWE02_19195 [Brucella pituitosa]
MQQLELDFHLPEHTINVVPFPADRLRPEIFAFGAEYLEAPAEDRASSLDIWADHVADKVCPVGVQPETVRHQREVFKSAVIAEAERLRVVRALFGRYFPSRSANRRSA